MASVFVPRAFGENLEREAANIGLNLKTDPWSVDWRRGILTADGVTVSLSDGSSVLLTAPSVAVDFHQSRMLAGWHEAVYQVYVHHPTVEVSRRSDGDWNWVAWAEALAPEAATRSTPFNLSRLYADVVEVRLNGSALMDNGVLTATNICLPRDGRMAPTEYAAHLRVGGGKFSLNGSGNFFTGSGARYSATVRVGDVAEGVASKLDLEANATYRFRSGRTPSATPS